MEAELEWCITRPETGKGMLKPDFGLLVCRIVREYISDMLNNPICGNLLQQFQEINIRNQLGYIKILKNNKSMAQTSLILFIIHLTIQERW